MHRLVLLIIVALNLYLNKNNKVGYFHSDASGDEETDLVDNELSQICCLHRCETINGFIEILVDSDENEVIDMFLYF